MTIEALKAAVAQAAMELEQASGEHDAAKARHRAALVTGTEPDRAEMLAANERIMAARDKFDLCMMELQSEQAAIISKAAQGHIRSMNHRIAKILAPYSLETTA